MKPKGVVLLSDSKCSISAVDTTTRVLKPFFHNKVAEILDNISHMRKYCEVEDIHYVRSEENPADLATRGNISALDLGPESYWQQGPSFLCSRRELWPVSRDFTRGYAPDDEVRLAGKSAWTAYMHSYLTKVKTGSDMKTHSDGEACPQV